jgi:hypothetical protein
MDVQWKGNPTRVKMCSESLGLERSTLGGHPGKRECIGRRSAVAVKKIENLSHQRSVTFWMPRCDVMLVIFYQKITVYHVLGRWGKGNWKWWVVRGRYNSRQVGVETDHVGQFNSDMGPDWTDICICESNDCLSNPFPGTFLLNISFSPF